VNAAVAVVAAQRDQLQEQLQAARQEAQAAQQQADKLQDDMAGACVAVASWLWPHL